MTDRIEDALASAGSEHEPPPDWQRKVWQRIAREDRAKRPPSRIWCVVLAALLAAAAGLAVHWYEHAAHETPHRCVVGRVLLDDQVTEGDGGQLVVGDRCTCREAP